MATSIETLGLVKLPLADQLVLVQELWNHLANHSDHSFLTAAQRDELRRRVAEDDAQPGDGIPWDEVKAQFAKRNG